MDDIQFERGCGNVFRDIGRPNPEEHLLKAMLVSRISHAIEESRFEPADVEKLMGWTKSEMDAILRGRFADRRIDEFLDCLNTFGYTVKIVVSIEKSDDPRTTILMG
jgi:predicted XRE-type DNA-binding protein